MIVKYIFYVFYFENKNCSKKHYPNKSFDFVCEMFSTTILKSNYLIFYSIKFSLTFGIFNS